MTPDRVREAMEKRFGDWPRNPRALQTVPRPAAPGGAGSAEIPVPDKSQTSIVWGHSGGLRRQDPDFYATQVMNLILGGGALVSRLGSAIRDEQGLAYSVVQLLRREPLSRGRSAPCSARTPTNTKKAVAALEAEIQRIRRDGVTAREVDEAVAYLTGRFPLRLETNAGVSEILWGMEFYGLGDDYIDRYAGYYRAVTVAQVNAAAQAHLHPDRATVVIAGPLP